MAVNDSWIFSKYQVIDAFDLHPFPAIFSARNSNYPHPSSLLCTSSLSFSHLSVLLSTVLVLVCAVYSLVPLFSNSSLFFFLNREDISTAITTEFHVSFRLMMLSPIQQARASIVSLLSLNVILKKPFCFLEHLLLQLVHSHHVLWQCYYNIINQNNNNNTIMAFWCPQCLHLKNRSIMLLLPTSQDCCYIVGVIAGKSIL